MKRTILFLMFVSINVISSEKNDLKIRNFFIDICSHNQFFRYNFNELTGWIKEEIDSSVTEASVENILLSIANEEYQIVSKDTTKSYSLLYCSAKTLDNYNSKKGNELIEMLYHSGDPEIADFTLEHMILKSDEWFKCAKNIIDSAEVKDYMLRYDLYNYLIFKLNNTPKNSPQFDSLKYLIYNAMVVEHWGHVEELDEIYTKLDSNYVFSKQRLSILTKFDNPKVKELISIRKKEKYAEKNNDLYLNREIIYNTYLKLKKQKNRLKDYIPPELK
jgi:hypothetical protein